MNNIVCITKQTFSINGSTKLSRSYQSQIATQITASTVVSGGADMFFNNLEGTLEGTEETITVTSELTTLIAVSGGMTLEASGEAMTNSRATIMTADGRLTMMEEYGRATMMTVSPGGAKMMNGRSVVTTAIIQSTTTVTVAASG